MNAPFDNNGREFHLTCRLESKISHIVATSAAELSELLSEVHRSGASYITVVDAEGRLVSFEMGAAATPRACEKSHFFV